MGPELNSCGQKGKIKINSNSWKRLCRTVRLNNNVRHHGTRAYGTLTAKNSCYRANYSYYLRDSQYVRRIRGFSLRKDKPSFEHGPIRHDYSLWRASSVLVLDGGSVYNCIVYVLLGRKRQMARFLEQEVVMPNKSPEPTAAVPCLCFSEAVSPPWLSFLR